MGRLILSLEREQGTPVQPVAVGPFEMILWEIVGYLVDDEQRGVAFSALRDRVGLTPRTVAAAPMKTLSEITRLGGAMAADERAARLRTVAQMVLDEWHGDLAGVLKLPAQKAKKELMKFPSVGEPGAEKILLFSRALGVLALESNGLRVLVRLGFGEERKSYPATYRAVREAVIEELPEDCGLLAKAHLILREHGRTVCLRNEPVCRACVLKTDCPSARVR